MPERRYNDTSILANLVDGALEGRKIKEDRLAQREKSRRDAREFATDRYLKPKFNEDGYFEDYEENEDWMSRDREEVLNRLQGVKKQGPSSAVEQVLAPPRYENLLSPEDKAAASRDMAQTGIGMNSYEQAQRQAPTAPQGPNPLIEDPDKKEEERQVRLSQMEAAADAKREEAKVSNKLDTTKVDPDDVAVQGGKVKPIYGNNQKVSFDKASVYGDPKKEDAPPVDPASLNTEPTPLALPAEEPEAERKFNPSPLMLKNFREMVTSPSKPILGPQGIENSGTLDPELQKILGVEGMNIPLPFTFIEKGIAALAKQREDADKKKSLPPILIDAVEKIENGTPYPSVARSLSRDIGREIPTEWASELKSAADRYNRSQQQKAQGERFDESKADKRTEKHDRALERFQKTYSGTGILDAAAALDLLDKETGIVSGKSVDKSKLPGYATNAVRGIPFVGQGAATMMAKTFKGEAAQQALQQLLNARIRNTSGQAVTKYEEGRVLIESGMGPGGNEDDVVRGVKLMMEGLKEAGQSVKAAFPREVINSYLENGGEFPDVAFKNSSRQKSAKKLGITKEKLEAIQAPDANIDGYAKRHRLDYDTAERILRSRGYDPGKK